MSVIFTGQCVILHCVSKAEKPLLKDGRSCQAARFVHASCVLAGFQLVCMLALTASLAAFSCLTHPNQGDAQG